MMIKTIGNIDSFVRFRRGCFQASNSGSEYHDYLRTTVLIHQVKSSLYASFCQERSAHLTTFLLVVLYNYINKHLN